MICGMGKALFALNRMVSICAVYKNIGIILIFFSIFGAHHSLANQDQPARVLAIFPGSRSAPINVIAYQALRDTIISQSPRPVDFFEETVELSRFASPELRQDLARLLRDRYHLYPPDVVVTGLRSQLDFLTQGEYAIFTNVPVIGLALMDNSPGRLAPNAIPVRWLVDCSATLDLALRLQPRMTNLVVVAGSSPIDQRFLEPVKEAIDQLDQPIHITWLTNHNQAEVIRHIGNLAFPGDGVFYVSLNLDRDGIHRMSYETMNRIHKVSKVPTYGYLSSYLEHGLTGGFFSRAEELGATGGEIVLRIVNGGASEMMNQDFVMPNFYYLNWPEMKRFGFSAAQLPGGAIILNRPPGLWETYWPWMLGGSGLIMALFSTGGVVVIRSRYQARLLREENRQRTLLENVRRQAENGELAAAIAHEINQPLASILSNTETLEIMLAKGVASENLAPIVDAIKKDDERASDIIRKIRDLYASRELELNPVDINELVNETIQLLDEQQKNEASNINFIPGKNLPCIQGNRLQLQQMLYNLMRNSLQASPDGETVTVSTNSLAGDRPGVSIELHDAGPGIPEKDQARIFEPYFSIRPGGTGLGLAISKKIVGAHRGLIAYRRHPENGSIFYVSLYSDQEDL